MQPVPEGYEPLDFVGFTDRGIWSSTETYIENDIVHKDNIVWRCLIDDTTGMTPAEGDNWTLFMDSTSPFYGSYDTFPVPGEPGRFYIDDTVDPCLMYTWDTDTQKYILTGGAGGADGGSVDIPITLTSAGWTDTTAPYSQTVTVPQMREGMTPLFFLASSGDVAQYAFSLITGYQTGYAEITFYAADKPTTDLSLTLKGIPAQELEYVDNTVVFLVEPSDFTINDTTQRYEATIPVDGMTEATGGTWDIVRSGPDLTVAESKIALSITDVDRMDGAVKITCLELPAQRYMMSIAGAYPDAEPGTVILANMQEWFDRVDNITCFSEKEVIIGKWTDGKPLYRKTFIVDAIDTSDGTEQLIDVTGLNADIIWIDVGNSFYLTSNGSTETAGINISFRYSLGYIRVKNVNNRAGSKIYVTVFYTKMEV